MAKLSAQDWHIFSMCLFPFVSLMGVYAAAFLGSKTKDSKFCKLLLCSGVMFSAGILLAGALVHSLPHAAATWDELESNGHDEDDHGDDHRSLLIRNFVESSYNPMRWLEEEGDRDDHEEEEEHHDEEEEDHDEEEEHSHSFPWPNTIFGMSFLFLLCVEAAAERAIDRFLGDQADGNFYGGAHHHPPRDNDDHEGHEHHAQQEEAMAITTADTAATKVQESAAAETSIGKEVDCDAPPSSMNFGPEHTATNNNTVRRRRSSVASSTFLVTAKRPSVVGPMLTDIKLLEEDVDEKQTMNPWVSLLLLIVLSIHVLLEGLALGSDDNAATIRSNFIAIIFHKGFSAFALGSSLIAGGYWDQNRPNGGRRMFYIMSLAYAAMDVIGIGIGMAIPFNEQSYGNAVLQSLLGGSFLFVATIELIPGELEKVRAYQFPVLPVMSSLLTGYGLMSLIGKWA